MQILIRVERVKSDEQKSDTLTSASAREVVERMAEMTEVRICVVYEQTNYNKLM